MQDLRFRLFNGFVGTLAASPLIGVASGLCGFIYAKFKDLPPSKVALAFVVWHATEAFFLTITATFSENKEIKAFCRIAVLITSSVIGTNELKKQGLLGQKMLICAFTIRAIAILAIVNHTFVQQCNSDPIKMDLGVDP